jgi:hypothetical protein
MREPQLFLMMGILIAISACSEETVKRTTYETLQNIGEAQCQKDLSADCPDRESYETYKRNRSETETGEY